MLNRKNVLWLDCTGGIFVGILVLLFCQLIRKWDNLPLEIIIFVGVANLVYGSYSLWVSTRDPRPVKLVKLLAIANMAWLGVCLAIIALHWQEISTFGVIHKLGEGLYVSALGYLEWRWKESLAAPAEKSSG